MKELVFLFNHFIVFKIVWIVVLLDFFTTIFDAKQSGTFSFAALPDVLRKLMYYTVYLMFGNIAEYYSGQTGQSIGMAGIMAAAGIIFTAEGGQFRKKLTKLFKL